MRRLPAHALLLAVVALAPIVPLATSAHASASDDSYLVAAANDARGQDGLPAYAVASDLSADAQQHADAMAQSRSVYDDPSLGSDVCCWQAVGENSGAGPSASAVQQAFMNSPEHRANILSSTFTQIGVGTARGSDGQLYVAEVFRQPSGSAAPPPPPPPATSAPAPTIAAAPARSVPVAASRSEWRVPLTVPHVLRPNLAALLRRRLARLRASLRPARDPLAAAQLYWHTIGALTARAG